MASSSSRGEMEKMGIDQLKALKEQADLEVNLLQNSLNNIRTATVRLDAAAAALNDLSPLIGDVTTAAARNCAPIMLRLAWHDAGTYDAKKKTGGPNGSIRFKEELNRPHNKGSIKYGRIRLRDFGSKSQIRQDPRVDVLSIIPAPEDVAGLEDCSWPDEVRDPGVEVIMRKIEEGCEFNRGMFVGGLRGVVLPVEPPPRVVNKGKRKVRSKQSGEHLVKGGSSRKKKMKVRSGRGRHVQSDPNTSLLGALKYEIDAGLKEARGDVYAHVCVDLKAMELRLERSMKQSIFSAVAEALSARELVKNVVDGVGVGNFDPYSQPPANGASNSLNHANVPTHLNVGTEEVDGSSSASEASNQSEASRDSIDGESGIVSEVVGESDGCPSSEKFKKLVELLEPRFDFEYGGGLVLKETELRLVASSIPPENPQVMDACVTVMRESIFINTDPASVPRADMLTSQFHGSLASMYSKFKKVRRKESFDFDADLLSSLSSRFTSTGRQWLVNIDYLYSPFNIAKNRWIAVMVDLPSHSLSVFDSTANVRRGSRLKPELEFLCEMFPYLVRQVGANDLMLKYPLTPLSFTRHTRITQASDCANTGMLSLLFMEAHAVGGFEKVCQVSESGIRHGAEQLAVQLYEHCCGDIEV
ncbi:unnamed protein product [Arabidopsis arenosa]|uniref:Ubiquitin-like protease family profile domain-containing protein n=1 Tax=Arabidopsis arenosa TaxID=38785 RepID=A0A8S2A293_ARAAE|nr:unnamed protein product [Arabidopsis arenosa]